MTKGVSTFLLRQRAFLKLYMITLTEQEKMYGLDYLDELEKKFARFGYRPNHSEIYKSLHELIDDGILERYSKTKQGKKYQKVIYYQIKNPDEARRYKKMLKSELERSSGLLQKALKDNYS